MSAAALRRLEREREELEERINRLEVLARQAVKGQAHRPAVVPLERMAGTVAGWRVWTVLPWEDARGGQSARLTSYNGHTQWLPMERLHATCRGVLDKGTAKQHDAPQFGCNCGVWAYRSSERLGEELPFMLEWIRDNVGDVPYAVGEVALWGRVLEFRDGYRAEYAYPYGVTVHAQDETLAKLIRNAYGIDVAWQPPPAKALPEPSAEEPMPERPASSEPPFVRPKLTPDRVLAAYTQNLVEDLERCRGYMWWEEGKYRWNVGGQQASEIASAIDATHWRKLLRPVKEQLAVLEAEGMFEHGRYRYAPETLWRPTAAGYERLLGRRISDKAREAVTYFQRGRQITFTWQVEAMRPGRIAERLAAKANGRDAYMDWLEQARAISEEEDLNRVVFDDEEIVGALREAVADDRRGMVTFAKMIDRLAPGRPTGSEASVISHQLTRLRKQGVVISTRVGSEILWAA